MRAYRHFETSQTTSCPVTNHIMTENVRVSTSPIALSLSSSLTQTKAEYNCLPGFWPRTFTQAMQGLLPNVGLQPAQLRKFIGTASDKTGPHARPHRQDPADIDESLCCRFSGCPRSAEGDAFERVTFAEKDHRCQFR